MSATGSTTTTQRASSSCSDLQILPPNPLGWFLRAFRDEPFGGLRPDHALAYVWASRIDPGEVFDSPVGSRIRMMVLRSSCRDAGGWQVETRELGEDYARTFDTTLPEILGVAVMTDTDDTRGHAIAWYADVSWSTASGRPLPVPF